MSYHDVFELFTDKVRLSIQQDNFAKLTMAKTIGRADLKNIFLRPVFSNDSFKLLLKYRFTSREIEDKEEECTLEEAFKIIEVHLRNPFLSVILFTTTKDVTFKINKKGAGSLSETPPTFQNIIKN